MTIRPNWLPRSVSRIAVATIYLPPSTTNNEIDEFYDYLCYCIDTLILESIETAFIITGDFNPNSNTFRSRLVEQQCNLKQVVHVPTRNGHILDLILTNISKYYNAPITQAPLDTSDHLVVLWQAKGIEKSKNVTRKVEVRPIKESSLESFGEWLRTYQWESTMSMYSLNEKLEHFTKIVHDKIEHHFPKRTVKFHAEDKPFITGKVKNLIIQRNRAFSNIDKQLYKVLRNKVTKEIKREKRRFYNKKIKPLRSSDSKSWWNAIKKVCGINNKKKIFLSNPVNGKPLTSEDAAEEINKYFVNLTNDYSMIHEEHLVVGQNLELPTVARNSVIKKLQQVNVNKSSGPFDPPQKIIKRFAVEFSIPLTDIINTSFREKRFGDIWKAYNICPIPKCNPCTAFESIRPIAITSIFSKIQESYALEWMLDDSKENISRRQFGGIPGSSPVLALLEMLHNWYSAMETLDTVIRVIFLDFTKAFDLIDHNILLSDLKEVGVRPALLPWLASYLSQRQQRVKFDGKLSEFQYINAGVPQGSKIGPFSFIAKINRLPDVAVTRNSINTEQVSIFIDDTTVSEILDVTNHKSNQPIGNMEFNIQRISNFCTEQRMVLNVKKTKEMIFDFRARKTAIRSIKLYDSQLERVSSFKLLGVWLQDNLKWDKNTEFIVKKARKRLYFLKVLKKYGAPIRDLLQFYCSVIRSTLEYGDVLWHGGLTNAQSNQIERIQKRAFRIILPGIDYSMALNRLKMQMLSERRETHCVDLIANISSPEHRIHNLLPDRVRDTRQRETRSNPNMYYNFKFRTERFKNSPLVYAINCYNSILARS